MKLTCQNAAPKEVRETRNQSQNAARRGGFVKLTCQNAAPKGVHATRKPSQRANPRELALVVASVIPLSKPHASCQRRREGPFSFLAGARGFNFIGLLVYLFGLLFQRV